MKRVLICLAVALLLGLVGCGGKIKQAEITTKEPYRFAQDDLNAATDFVLNKFKTKEFQGCTLYDILCEEYSEQNDPWERERKIIERYGGNVDDVVLFTVHFRTPEKKALRKRWGWGSEGTWREGWYLVQDKETGAWKELDGGKERWKLRNYFISYYMKTPKLPAGRTKNVVITLDESEILKRKDMRNAAFFVRKEFRRVFKGCTLQKLYYDDIACNAIVNREVKDASFEINPENTIVIFIEYLTEDSYLIEDYHWILIRDSNGSSWRVHSRGLI